MPIDQEKLNTAPQARRRKVSHEDFKRLQNIAHELRRDGVRLRGAALNRPYIFPALLAAEELNISYSAALWGFSVNEHGVMMASVHLKYGMAKNSGLVRVEFLELSEQKCRINFVRTDTKEQFLNEWCWEDAVRAGLDKRETYKRYPKALLRARCLSEGLNIAVPEVVNGIYTPEDLGEGFSEDQSGEWPELDLDDDDSPSSGRHSATGLPVADKPQSITAIPLAPAIEASQTAAKDRGRTDAAPDAPAATATASPIPMPLAKISIATASSDATADPAKLEPQTPIEPASGDKVEAGDRGGVSAVDTWAMMIAASTRETIISALAHVVGHVAKVPVSEWTAVLAKRNITSGRDLETADAASLIQKLCSRVSPQAIRNSLAVVPASPVRDLLTFAANLAEKRLREAANFSTPA